MVFLTECVLDLGIRRQILASWGLCRRHAWALATRTDSGGPLATAIVYENLVASLLEHCQVRPAEGGATSGLTIGFPDGLATVVPGRSCPVCEGRSRVERNYVNSFIKYSPLRAFLAAYKASDGFCPDHLGRVMARARPGLRALLLQHRMERLRTPVRDAARPSPRGLPSGLSRRLGCLVRPFPFYPGSIEAQRHITIVGSRVHSGALDQEGECTVCQGTRALERSLLSAMLEPGAPHGILGLCADHAWMFYRMAWRAGAAEPLRRWLQRTSADEAAALRRVWEHEQVAAREAGPWRRWLGRPQAEPLPHRKCAVCTTLAEAAIRLAGEEVSGAGGRQAAFCLVHANLALRSAPATGATALRRRLLEQAWALRAELGQYIHKTHWEHRHEPWNGEQDSWWRAVRFFVGDE